jgi:hypothetical protein
MHRALSLLLLALLACKHDKPAAPPHAASGETPARAGGAGSAGKWTCATLIPPTVRTKYLPEARIDEVAIEEPTRMKCEIWIDGSNYYVDADCNDEVAAQMEADIAHFKEISRTIKELPGVGKRALIMPPLNGVTNLQAYDDNSNCLLELTMPSKVDIQALAKELLEIL